MKRTRVAAATILIAAAGAAFAAWWHLPIWRGQQIVRAKLKDPDSARFEQVTHNRQNDVVCGWVNAKNSLGGYTGRKLFMLSGEKVVFEPSTSAGAREAFMYELTMACRADVDYGP